MRPSPASVRLLLAVVLAGVAPFPSRAAARASAQEPPVSPEALRTAYVDAGAAELVRLARERRRTVDRSIEAYRTTASERMSVGLRAVWRERLIWQRDVATRIAWEREGPVRMEVLGAREVFPSFVTEPQVPAALGGWLPHLAFDPADPYLLTGPGTGGATTDDAGAGGAEVPHPLAAGSEAHYRFRSGDTTVIALPDGREVRLVELEVIPRRRAWNLVQGSFWLEARTHAVARVTVRPSDYMDLERDQGDDVPALLGHVRFSVEHITIDYALWELEWWLPRLFAIRGSASLGRLADVPFSYERKYSEYDVTGEPGSAEPMALEASPYAPGARVRCPTRAAVAVRVGGSGASKNVDPPPPDTVPSDSLVAVPVSTDTTLSEAQRRECERYTVWVPADSAALLASPALPPDPFRYGEALLTEDELEDIRERLGDLTPMPLRATAPGFEGPLGGPGLVRYNRVEGLSLGARAELALGPVRTEGTLRLGLADLEPTGELALVREGPARRLRLAGYRRLQPMDPLERPFSLGSSLQSLLFGLDEADLFRTLGAELTGDPARSRPRRWQWSLYARRERAASKETDLSLPHLLDGGRRFPDGDSAVDASQYGAAIGLRHTRGHDPGGFRLDAELTAEASSGTFDYGRSSLALRLGFPLPGPWVGSLEGAAGASAGRPAVQHLWRLGGAATLRGYPSGVVAGESFWRARIEAGTALPAMRFVLFSDAGRAGALDGGGGLPWLVSVGAGVSLLDGLVRIDVARALRSPAGWRLVAYLDGWL